MDKESAEIGATNGTLDEKFLFRTPARLEYRSAAKSFIDQVCAQLVDRAVMSEKLSHQLVSAFVEAYNNVVVHAYEGRVPGDVEVIFEVSSAKVALSVIDRGEGFNLSQVPEPDLDALPEGGMGLFIIKSFMDKVEFRRQDERNVLYMEKLLDREEESVDVGIR